METIDSHGCACGHHTETPTQILSDEHRVIERILEVLEKMAKGQVGALEPWKKVLDFLRHFADECHHFKEEKVLFPALEAHGIPSEGGPIGMMLIEHEEGRSYVRSMAAALSLVEANNEAAKENLFSSAQAYCRLLRDHIRKEDEVLFRMADDVIPPDEQKRLLRDFAKHEAEEMGPATHQKYLALVSELEAAA